MSSVEHILFPTDLSEVSQTVVPWVEKMATGYEATVHILFVARAYEYYSGIGVPYTVTETFTDELKRTGEIRLKEFVLEHLSGVSTVLKVERGYPAEEILNYVKENGIDLIIMGTHGRKGLEKVLFGSVADYVVKHSEVPVLTVNPYRDKNSKAS